MYQITRWWRQVVTLRTAVSHWPAHRPDMTEEEESAGEKEEGEQEGEEQEEQEEEEEVKFKLF